MIAIKNVLVATDFEEAAGAALEYGRNMARTFGARLHIVHVVDDLWVRMAADFPQAQNVGRMQGDLAAAAEARLRALVTDDDRRTLQAKWTCLTDTSPATAITAYAAGAAIDVIVMGTHGRARVARWLLGSVADRVVRSAPCPVLVVRHPEREFIVPDALQTVAHA
jgi:nucleotide-binding universal stress UspA family protein